VLSPQCGHFEGPRRRPPTRRPGTSLGMGTVWACADSGGTGQHVGGLHRRRRPQGADRL
jgi:hypothetical protein